jgi:hypothetical protein
MALRKKAPADALVRAQSLGANVREFFSSLLGDLEEANGHATQAVAESDAVIAEHSGRKAAALAEIDANAKLRSGLAKLVG